MVTNMGERRLLLFSPLKASQFPVNATMPIISDSTLAL